MRLKAVKNCCCTALSDVAVADDLISKDSHFDQLRPIKSCPGQLFISFKHSWWSIVLFIIIAIIYAYKVNKVILKKIKCCCYQERWSMECRRCDIIPLFTLRLHACQD